MKYKKKKTSYTKSEIRKLNIKLWSASLDWLLLEFISATEGRNNQLFKDVKRNLQKQVNLAPIETNKTNQKKKIKIGKLAQNSHFCQFAYNVADLLLQRHVSFYLPYAHILHIQ